MGAETFGGSLSRFGPAAESVANHVLSLIEIARTAPRPEPSQVLRAALIEQGVNPDDPRQVAIIGENEAYVGNSPQHTQRLYAEHLLRRVLEHALDVSFVHE